MIGFFLILKRGCINVQYNSIVLLFRIGFLRILTPASPNRAAANGKELCQLRASIWWSDLQNLQQSCSGDSNDVNRGGQSAREKAGYQPRHFERNYEGEFS